MKEKQKHRQTECTEKKTRDEKLKLYRSDEVSLVWHGAYSHGAVYVHVNCTVVANDYNEMIKNNGKTE